MQRLSRRWLTAVLLVAAAGAYYAVALHAPPGPRSLRAFDPERMAELELRMWQAYYRKEKVRLFALLVTMLHEQNRYPWAKAMRAGYHLARAASAFGDAREGYERVLPDLEAAYAIARDWTRAGFEPRAVARAELAWWVARRQPGANSVESVGGLIADEYALLYEAPRERVVPAAMRRAEAAALRDRGGAAADWDTVGSLLTDSFRLLHAGLADTPTATAPAPKL
jgi:hypothetical protein